MSGLSADGERPEERGRRDQRLVELVRGGDPAAFTELYRAHVAAVRRVVGDNVSDKEAQADVVQDTFARALAGLTNLRDGASFRSWLLSIARHAAIDHRRNRGRIVPVADVPEHGRDDAGPDTAAELNELSALVRGCVAGLSRRDATAVAMVTHLGFSTTDVAAAFHVSPGAAKVIVHRARRRLRQALVLEVMVRRQAVGCPAFAAAYDSVEAAAAARHVRHCATCADLVRAEVQVYRAG